MDENLYQHRKIESLVFFSYMESEYSRSGVFLPLAQLKSNQFHQIPTGFLSTIRYLMNYRKNNDLRKKNLVVLSPSHILTIYIAAILNKKPILDAGWPLSDSDRSLPHSLKKPAKIVKSFLIDFMAFKAAKKIIVESENQREYISKVFLVPREKLDSIYTGVNEIPFHSKKQLARNKENSPSLRILFRGKYNADSGLEIIAKVTQLLMDYPIYFTIASNDSLPNLNFSKNTSVIRKFISADELRRLYQETEICLGQFSSLPRAERTIPHKFYEAYFFGKCYLSPESKALQEVITSENSLVLLRNNNPHELAERLIELISKPQLVKKIGEQNLNHYKTNYSQKILSERFISSCTM